MLQILFRFRTGFRAANLWGVVLLTLTIPVLLLGADAPSNTPVAAATRPAETKPKPSYDPVEAYESRQVAGWTVMVHKDLLAKEDLVKPVLQELESQLQQVIKRIPPKAVEKLKTVRIWMELSDPRCPGGCYHPNEGWLRANGYNPAKTKGVQFGNARNFITWTRDQPFMVLHELAHAYHDQILGHDCTALNEGFRAARDSKRYEEVLHIGGGTRKHYGMNNPDEFFAEMSEAFFGTNDMYPFVRGELKSYDPTTYRLIAELWGARAD